MKAEIIKTSFFPIKYFKNLNLILSENFINFVQQQQKEFYYAIPLKPYKKDKDGR